MKPLDSLIQDLESSNPAIRDQAALDLMELGNDAAVIPLLAAITKPENANNRGTLVYALGAFDCLNHLEALVDLVLTGNYEVSTCAFSIIDECKLSTEAIQRITLQMGKHDQHHLQFTHSSEAYEALLQLVLNQGT